MKRVISEIKEIAPVFGALLLGLLGIISAIANVILMFTAD